jgi:hypothetical protein
MVLHLSDKSLVSLLLVAMLLQVLISLGLFVWGRWVARRQGRGRWWRLCCWLPMIGLAVAAAGLAVVAVFLVQGYGALSDGDPAARATRLAQTISEAMNCAALFGPIAWAFYLGGIVVFTIGSVRKPKPRR